MPDPSTPSGSRPASRRDWAPHVRPRLSSLRLSPAREYEIVEELSQHLEDRWRELKAGGASDEDATSLALAEFREGNLLARYMAPLQQAHAPAPITPGASAGSVFRDVWLDLRYAIRMLRRQPAFSLTAILTLGLGIGATTAMFSVVNGVVIKPLHYPESENVVTVGVSAVFGSERTPDFPLAPRMFSSYAENSQSFQDFGLFTGAEATVTGSGSPERANTLQVTRGILTALGVQPALGRWFSPDDHRPGTEDTAILSHGYWQRRFGGDPGVIGRVIRQELGHFSDAGGRRPLVADKLYDLGRYGQKRGKGWYRYDESRKATPNPEVIDLIRSTAAEAGIPQRTFSDAEIVERCLYALITKARASSPTGQRSVRRTSTSSTRTATDFRRGAAGRCSTQTASAPRRFFRASRTTNSSSGRDGRRRHSSWSSPQPVARSAISTSRVVECIRSAGFRLQAEGCVRQIHRSNGSHRLPAQAGSHTLREAHHLATAPARIDPASLVAIDVHVHLEADEQSATDDAARGYFGDTGAPRDPDGLAEYYRSRRMAFVVFTVDERLSGRRHVTNDDVLEFAAEHRRRRDAVRERRSDPRSGGGA